MFCDVINNIIIVAFDAVSKWNCSCYTYEEVRICLSFSTLAT